MRRIWLLLALVGLATTATARHNETAFSLKEVGLEDPGRTVVAFDGTMSFWYDGYHCFGDGLGGEGMVVRDGAEPAVAWIFGCVTMIAGSTSAMWLQLYVPADGWWRDYDLVGPNLALVGAPYGEAGHRTATASLAWGPADYFGIHEGDPVPCWDLVDDGC